MRLALYQPDIPQNTGTLIRLGACLGLPVDIIEPCGFLFTDKKLKRAGMDYTDMAEVYRHASWQDYLARHGDRRLILLTTRGSIPYTDFHFEPEDVLLLGRESAGVPDEVHNRANACLRIPIRARSLNVAIAGAIVAGEALRQTKAFPPDQP